MSTTSQGRAANASDSVAGRVVPDNLVQLKLQAHRQIVGNDPVREGTNIDLAVTRREQHLSGTSIQPVLDQLADSPVIILAGTDDELDLIVARYAGDVLVAVTRDLRGPRRFKVHYTTDTLIHHGDIECTTGLQ